MEPTAPAAPERPRRRLGWPTVVIALATLLIGGFIGYAAGRPNEVPPVHGALGPGQVRVPDLRDVDAADARAILGPLHLQVGAIGLRQSREAPKGIVIEQDPPGGAAVPSGTGVDLVASSGPGPGASAMYEFARSVLLPITHAGTIEWTSDPIALGGDPVSLGANTRVIGDAGVSPYRVSVAKSTQPGATAITVSVDVSSFRTPAWFLIERAFTRQRESPAPDAGLTAAPALGPAGHGGHARGASVRGLLPRHVGLGDGGVLARRLGAVCDRPPAAPGLGLRVPHDVHDPGERGDAGRHELRPAARPGGVRRVRWGVPFGTVPGAVNRRSYSTVTLFARLRGWSTSQPRSLAMWYASSWSGTLTTTGDSSSWRPRDVQHVVGDAGDLLVALGRHGDDRRRRGP